MAHYYPTNSGYDEHDGNTFLYMLDVSDIHISLRMNHDTSCKLTNTTFAIFTRVLPNTVKPIPDITVKSSITTTDTYCNKTWLKNSAKKINPISIMTKTTMDPRKIFDFLERKMLPWRLSTL